MVNKIFNKIKKISPLGEIKRTEREFREKIVTLILGGFGLVAALAWNDAIQTFFATYLKKSGEIIGKFIYALMVTIIIVIVSRYLEKISAKKE